MIYYIMQCGLNERMSSGYSLLLFKSLLHIATFNLSPYTERQNVSQGTTPLSRLPISSPTLTLLGAEALHTHSRKHPHTHSQIKHTQDMHTQTNVLHNYSPPPEACMSSCNRLPCYISIILLLCSSGKAFIHKK